MAKTFREYLEQSSLFTFDSTTGQIIPDTTEVLSAIKQMMVDIFDQRLDVSDETPAGRIAESYAIAVKRFAAVTAAYANQINPHYATGQMLDAIGSLFAVSRTGATATTIYITIAGTPGTLVPNGSIIEDQKGNRFVTQTPVTIPSGGGVSSTAVCSETGPIEVDTGTVTNIVSSIIGWSSVTNTGTMSVGEDIESDQHFRNRILLARWTGTAFVESIRAAIERCDNVDSVYVIENGNGTDKYLKDDMTFVDTQPESGKYILVKAHSVCIVVYGKSLSSYDDKPIAKAIFSTKSAGCAYTSLGPSHQGTAKGTEHNTTVVDDASGIVYNVIFNTPSVVTFGVNISVNKGSFSGTTAELQALVKNAIVSWANGEVPFVDGLKLGQSLYAFEIGAAVSDVIPSIQIADVQLSVDGTTKYSRNMFIYEVGVINPASVNVYIDTPIPTP